MRVVCMLFLILVAPLRLMAEEPICVIKSKAQLRSGPGAKFPVTWKVSQNMPLLKVGQKSGWLQVRDVDGKTHWISKKMVSHKVSCAVVRSKTAKLMRGPEPSSPAAQMSVVDRYTPFRKIDRDGAWVLVQDDYRGRYWVHEDNIWIPMARARVAF